MEKYIFSFVVDNEQPINKYQLVLDCNKRENGKILPKTKYIRPLNNEYLAFKAKLILEKLSSDKIIEFLEFHFDQYTGDKIEFLHFVVMYLENEYLSRIQPPNPLTGKLTSIECFIRKTMGDNSNPLESPLFNTLRKWVELKKFTLNNTKINYKTGFKSKLHRSQIKILWEQLKAPENSFIAPEPGFNSFEAVFSSKPLPPGFEPVKWISEPVLLAYLIYELKEQKNISKIKHWSIAENCFTNSKNLRQLADGFRNSKTGKPKDHDSIDEILNCL